MDVVPLGLHDHLVDRIQHHPLLAHAIAHRDLPVALDIAVHVEAAHFEIAQRNDALAAEVEADVAKAVVDEGRSAVDSTAPSR